MDTVRAITQTTNGYLWIGTDEGLARFDGYRFVIYGKRPNELPDAAITALEAGSDGTLWIATARAITSLKQGVFRTWGEAQGLDRDALISDVQEGPDGSVWIAAGLHLFRLQNGNLTRYKAAHDSGIQGIRVVLAERDGTVWVAGYGSVGKLVGQSLQRVFDGPPLKGNIAMSISRGRNGTLLLSGTEGLFEIAPGHIARYTSSDGLPDTFVRSFHEDSDGNLWVGTNSGLARRQGSRFQDFSHETLHPHEWVWAIFEDRDGNLWIGANSGLHQFSSQPIGVLTQADGLPSDQPTAIHQDGRGRIWVGFHDRGAGYFDDTGKFVSLRGLPSQEVFSVRETRNGDMLVGSRGGLSRVHGDRVTTEFIPEDDLSRHNVFDAIEDSRGRLWMGTNGGLLLRETPASKPQTIVPGGVLLTDAIVALLESRDGSVWAGVYGHGLWQLKSDGARRLYTRENGIPGEGVRALYEASDGSIWIGTFNGGAARLSDNRIETIDSRNGLPSDIVGRILSARGDLWFATARGLARFPRQALDRQQQPTVYTVAEGLRSAQCVPGYPTGTGGTRTADGRLWFPTGFGIAVFDPGQNAAARRSPPASIVEVLVDGRPLPLDASSASIDVPAYTRRVEIRFAAVELTAPETLQYRYRLDGVDADWVHALNRRSTEYNNLQYGDYTFRVSASMNPGGTPGTEATLVLHRLPQWWELRPVRLAGILLLAAAVWGAWQYRLRQINRSFALVLEERSRIAREIHDTLAQGYVGIGSQLDAVAMTLCDHPDAAARHLELARRMSRHSLTEARRSIFDLRAGSTMDLPGSIRSAVAFVTAGRPVSTDFDMDAEAGSRLTAETGQQIVRIVQEAVANAVRHGSASRVWIALRSGGASLQVQIKDNGTGFDATDALLTSGGHFGLLGMQERAERIDGTFELQTQPGAGTTIRVTVPLAHTPAPNGTSA